MIKLLRLEYLKFRRNRVFRIMALLYLLLLPGLLVVGFNIKGIPEELGSIEQFFIFPTIWSLLAYLGNWLSFFFLGIVGVLSITLEFEHRTLRQNIITGLSRPQFFGAKWIWLFTLSALATLYYVLVAGVTGLLFTETIYLSKVAEGLSNIGRYGLMTLAYASFGWLVGTLLRRTGLALFSYLIYAFFVELLIRWALHFQYFPHPSMHYYTLNAFEDLAQPPIPQIAKEFMRENDFSLYLSTNEAVVIALAYLFLFWALIYWRMRRSDL